MEYTKRSVRLDVETVVLFNNIWKKEKRRKTIQLKKYILFFTQKITKVCVSEAGTFLSVWEFAAAHKAGTRKLPGAMSARYVAINVKNSFSLVSRVSSGQRHPSQVLLGDDLCLRSFREPGGLRRP